MRTVRVEELMTRQVVSAREDTPFKDLVGMMLRNAVSGLPVVDAEDRLVGIVTEADLLMVKESRQQDDRRSFLQWFLQPAQLKELSERTAALRAGDVMTTQVVTVSPDTPVQEAVRALLDAGVKRLPVVDEDRRVVGIASRRDLLRPFLRDDEEIRREIVDEVVVEALWLDPSAIDVQVSEGVVHLKGTVELRSEKEILEKFVRRVDGVVGVEEDVDYTTDDRKVKTPPPRPVPRLESPFRRR